MTLAGARAGALSGLRRLVALAMANDLVAFVVPGPEIARARGLDLEKAGLRLATTPRHAGVLLIVGPLPAGLAAAASIAYAQMPRPRAILALGASDIAPLPAADVSAGLSQEGLLAGLDELRQTIAAGAFAGDNDIADFSAPALEIIIEYSCPMHPEVVSDKPGNCPKCGMDLLPREIMAGAGHTGHNHSESEATMPKDKIPVQPLAAHVHEKTASASSHGEGEGGQYTCPMHPEVVSDGPGSCPKCGMFLEKVETKDEDDHSGHHHDHSSAGAIEGIEPQFMSMVELTKDQPRSSDGLQMDWIKVPYGPFFPGLPGGLGLDFVLDGDTVASSEAHSLVGSDAPLVSAPLAPREFVAKMSALIPLAPVSYGLLAVLALENAAGIMPGNDIARTRAAALERERIASHLSWLASFGAQTGFGWLAAKASSLQLKVQDANAARIADLAPLITSLLARARSAPLLRPRLKGIAQLDEVTADVTGPLARSLGRSDDMRLASKTYAALGFKPVLRTGADALARFDLRCGEIIQSLELIAAAGAVELPQAPDIGPVTTEGEAELETPRGAASLWLRLKAGKVIKASLDTPSKRHFGLIEELTAQQELGDALVAVNSLDLSPWEIGGEVKA